ncbi:ribose-5-phosphate isomerase RpiA [Hydrocarboniphaga sp.]|uniref:ribose-5-phosphate isomerase RpiA n=1 Tax=Hydrocarboniphaga sp. TaxID=2033016 RepID=UPI003D12A13C
MSQDLAKRKAAEAALRYVVQGEMLGVGTGSTVNHFIDLLAEKHYDIAGAVSSSEASTERLRKHGFKVVDLNSAGPLSVYVDGADEANDRLELIKGGGAALTREKIIAGASKVFVCIADESKLVKVLGKFPLPIEVLPMARSFVARELVKLGGEPVLREGVTTDNGNPIIDLRGMAISDARALETAINTIPGVVTVGLFAHRPADRLILGSPDGVREVLAQR